MKFYFLTTVLFTTMAAATPKSTPVNVLGVELYEDHSNDYESEKIFYYVPTTHQGSVKAFYRVNDMGDAYRIQINAKFVKPLELDNSSKKIKRYITDKIHPKANSITFLPLAVTIEGYERSFSQLKNIKRLFNSKSFEKFSYSPRKGSILDSVHFSFDTDVRGLDKLRELVGTNYSEVIASFYSYNDSCSSADYDYECVENTEVIIPVFSTIFE